MAKVTKMAKVAARRERGIHSWIYRWVNQHTPRKGWAN
jgi:hypothetical protein